METNTLYCGQKVMVDNKWNVHNGTEGIVVCCFDCGEDVTVRVKTDKGDIDFWDVDLKVVNSTVSCWE